MPKQASGGSRATNPGVGSGGIQRRNSIDNYVNNAVTGGGNKNASAGNPGHPASAPVHPAYTPSPQETATRTYGSPISQPLVGAKQKEEASALDGDDGK